MVKKDVITFFNKLAHTWDNDQVRNEEVIKTILEKGGIKKGMDVLDVACGTGVLFTDYINHGVASVTGIDISSEMVKISRCKFPQIEIICGDAETYPFQKQFDAVMIYNAFPHFTNPDMLFENLSKALKDGGRFSIAHGISEKELKQCHSSRARSVSMPLPSKEKLAEMMSEFFEIDVMISDERMYMVSGTKTKP